MNAHRLTLKELSLSLAGQTLLEIDRQIDGGEVFTVMGPSGSGKSSLLAYIAGFLAPVFDARGDVIIDDVPVTDLPAEQRGVGLLFQDPMLFPHMSVGGNLRFGMAQATPDKDRVIAERLAAMGLEGFADRDPHTLSGGQKSRVALLRLLLSEPRAVLLDEPFSKLDTAMRGELRRQVFGELRQAGLPVILVTHDRDDASAAGGDVLELGS